MQDQDLQIGW